MASFDTTNTVSSEFGIFGIPLSADESQLILIPVPWEVTTSYGAGASLGPKIIREASEQLDLFDLETGKAYENGYHMTEFPEYLYLKNIQMKKKAQEVIRMKTHLEDNLDLQNKLTSEINQACAEMVDYVYNTTKAWLNKGKLVGLVGGDHSTPMGFVKAIHEKYKGQFGILHIDAHADLRVQYQGFTHSHASIMHNIMTSNFRPEKLVQVGIRDFCEAEYDFIQSHPNDIQTFFDIHNKQRLLKGECWDQVCEDIIKNLPQNVYVSFDIDGLDPALCPNTGTPVAGGLSLDQAFFLFNKIHQSGRKIIAFDVNEVSPGKNKNSDWDGNVGARVLYKLCGWTIMSNS